MEVAVNLSLLIIPPFLGYTLILLEKKWILFFFLKKIIRLSLIFNVNAIFLLDYFMIHVNDLD